VTTLLIDNYDSFTYNLFHLLAEVMGTAPVVLRNDDVAGFRRLDLATVDNAVISPGPGRPDRERDFGLSRWVLERADLPVLGVCLGHQGLCLAAGAIVSYAPEPMHGRISAVHHDGTDLFAGIPSPFAAVRYHSLLARDLPADLPATAWTADRLVMAVRHRTRPHWGVQFHPESIATEYGPRLIGNFRDLSARFAQHRRSWPAGGSGAACRPAAQMPASPQPASPQPASRPPAPYDLRVVRLDHEPDAEAAYLALFAADPASFWLDSSARVPGLSRFSILGGSSGPLAERVSYDVHRRRVTVRRGASRPEAVAEVVAEVVAEHEETLFSYLDRELRARRIPDPGLPCDFTLGYVGYLGYEMRADCGAAAPHRAPTPDGGLLFADRAVVIDHEVGCAWLLALATAEHHNEVRGWFETTSRLLEELRPLDLAATEFDGPLPGYTLRHSPARYRQLIEECRREIREGESYEICLTNMITVAEPLDPVRAYRALRRISPAPYASLLRFPELSVLSSSPERFLRIDRAGRVESRPIKGTRTRGSTPVEDAAGARDLAVAEKDRAENLMIVDLVRNDLGVVSRVGSVHVPALFEVETYATVHQLVSTVRSELADGATPIDCVRAAFPGGSMTGAPKLRTMEIIDRLEGGWRGVYSGSLGYFSLNGAVDLSIVIRTAVLTAGKVHIGTGGAIVALSDVDSEVEETTVKAAALLRMVAAAR
jgi:para-aminobenzoate synthetase